MTWRELKEAIADEERRLGVSLDDIEVTHGDWNEISQVHADLGVSLIALS